MLIIPFEATAKHRRHPQKKVGNYNNKLLHPQKRSASATTFAYTFCSIPAVTASATSEKGWQLQQHAFASSEKGRQLQQQASASSEKVGIRNNICIHILLDSRGNCFRNLRKKRLATTKQASAASEKGWQLQQQASASSEKVGIRNNICLHILLDSRGNCCIATQKQAQSNCKNKIPQAQQAQSNRKNKIPQKQAQSNCKNKIPQAQQAQSNRKNKIPQAQQAPAT
jgi:hypothetical protein